MLKQVARIHKSVAVHILREPYAIFPFGEIGERNGAVAVYYVVAQNLVPLFTEKVNYVFVFHARHHKVEPAQLVVGRQGDFHLKAVVVEPVDVHELALRNLEIVVISDLKGGVGGNSVEPEVQRVLFHLVCAESLLLARVYVAIDEGVKGRFDERIFELNPDSILLHVFRV